MSFSITYTTLNSGKVVVDIVLPENEDLDPDYYNPEDLEPLPARVQGVLEKNRVLKDIRTSGNRISAMGNGEVGAEKLHIPVLNSCSIYISDIPKVEYRYGASAPKY